MKKFLGNTFKIIFFTGLFFATISLSISIFPSLKETFTKSGRNLENLNSKNIYELTTDVNVLGYDIRDVKLKQYFTVNPPSYTFEKGDYVFELTLDQQKLFQYPRTDYYYYLLTATSQKDDLEPVGWQTSGIDLHESPAESFKSSVTGITADYRIFPKLGNKPVFVVTVKDNGEDYLYVIYPKQLNYNGDFEKAKNIDYVVDDEYNEHGFKEGVNVKFNDYQFMDKENTIRMFIDNAFTDTKSILVIFEADENGKVSITTKQD